MSLRLRLTLLYSTILALTLTGFSIASYVTVAQDGLNRLEATLASKAQRIVADAQFDPNEIALLVNQYAGPEIYVQTRSAAGEIMDRSQNLGENRLPVDEAVWGTAVSSWTATTFIAGERRLIYNQPIEAGEAAGGLLQISNSLTDRDRLLTNLGQVLVAGNLLVILAAVASGWWLAGIGLRPISRLARAILKIGQARDFGRRVNYVGADDEIGQLATTFDQMLAELEDAHRQTEQALQTQRRFVADASHELRTPLTTVRGNLELLRREPPISDGDRYNVLADLVEETDRLIRLVNDLLILARADVQPPNWQEPVALQPLLNSVQRQMKQLAPERHIQFANGRSLSTTVLGNEDALKQVLLILLDNAVKHTPPEAEIKVETAVTHSQITINVCDTGPGIPAEEITRIFDRFYVVDTARSQDSTGLGLSIAKTLVESQNGRINVVSNPRQGTVFEVTLSCQK
ncbi:sensor histidine kinase [Candidatus Leptofilum sp.]|uniref:sensor histidine kinase n=1 Tax=Candidatus Leptofilum sp. TaxID=3241576 RepID=UPI003B59171A